MRQPKPWYRADKDCWYARVGGKRVSLQVRGRKNAAEAYAAWHTVLANGPKEAPVKPAPDTDTVTEAVDGFLADTRVRTKPATHELYTRHLQKLKDKHGKKPVTELSPTVLTKWLLGLEVSSTTQAITLRSVSAFFGWCVRHEIVDRNPVQAMSKPKSKSRGEESVITAEVHAKLLAAATPQLRLVLTILHATGARPGEVCGFTAENFDAAAGVVKLAEHKTDHTGRVRLIFLPAEAVEVLKGQVQKYGSGPLLRNRLGRAWTGKAVAWQVNRLCRKVGVKAIPYGYRHTFATDALAQGVPDAQVAQLLGHGSTAMLHKHYSHLGSKARAMADALKRVR